MMAPESESTRLPAKHDLRLDGTSNFGQPNHTLNGGSPAPGAGDPPTKGARTMTIAVDDEVFAAASRRAHLAARRDFGAMLLRRSAA